MQKLECLHTGTLDAPKWTGEYAKKYPFTLDPFQEVSIACIVRRSLTFQQSLTFQRLSSNTRMTTAFPLLFGGC